tara:strand:- start:9747 stop:10844 length:1098 start_codon:yes stop_codon:yes gene_type:complete
MKNILYIYSEQPDYVRVKKNLELLSQNGYQVIYVGCMRGGQEKRQPPFIKNVVYEVLKLDLPHGGSKSAFKTLIFLLKAALLVKKYQPDIVVGVNEESCLFLKLFTPRQKYLVELYDSLAFRCRSSQSLKGRLLKLISSYVINGSSGLIEVSEERLKLHPIISNCTVVPNTPDTLPDSKKTQKSLNPYIFVSGSFNDKINGIEELLTAVKNLNGRVHIKVAGRPSGNFVRNTFITDKHVDFLGYVSKEEAAELAANSLSMFAFYKPISEIYRLASPNKVFDAMCCACPILMNTDCMASSFPIEGGFGLGCRYDDTVKLTHNIELLLSGEFKLNKQAVINRFTSEFSWNKLSHKYLEVVENAIRET